MIPVIFIRSWNPTGGHFAGLPVAIKQAQKWNDRVILIGDQQQPEAVKNMVEFHQMEKYSEFRKAFQPAWDNIHGANRDAWFLRASLLNWLVLAEWMDRVGVDFACTVDTDVLIFDRIEDMYRHWASYDIATCNPMGTMQAPTFVTREAALKFVDYLMDLFWGMGNAAEMDACKCCMSAWRLAAAATGMKVGNLCDIIDGATWDHNLGMSYGYQEERNGDRRLDWKGAQPYGYLTAQMRSVRFRALHCWGKWKARMNELVRKAEESCAK